LKLTKVQKIPFGYPYVGVAARPMAPESISMVLKVNKKRMKRILQY
jgi:hypothetical protein